MEGPEPGASDASVAASEPLTGTTNFFASVTLEILPRIGSALPLSSLSAFGSTAKAGHAALHGVPPEVWQVHLERQTAIRIEAQALALPADLMDHLRFWLSSAREMSLQVLPGQMWVFADAEELAASRFMAQDAAALLHELSAGHAEPWQRRMPWWPPCSTQRLAFSFGAEALAAMRAAREQLSDPLSQEVPAPATWDSLQETLEVRAARIPCVLRISLELSDGHQLCWAVQMLVQLSSSDISLYHRGVHKAVVVYLFASSMRWHTRAPRCVSFQGCDGQAPVFPDGNSLCSEHPSHWLQHLLTRGGMYAIAVVDCIEYMM
uniref:Uncharacterized protein n=1 Tax=Alexandrium monilatum TaxID=311494 RepID=A0A7S4Q5B5_9DINO|mmetsp:Transcript_48424/g.144636  ORF Transcript_48424/g.144636 Transcript_48424/m.144636 type:complete len:321 (-) Transcript_48424:50-1012(-)